MNSSDEASAEFFTFLLRKLDLYFARAPVLRHAQADPTAVAEAKQEVRALLSILEGRAFAL